MSIVLVIQGQLKKFSDNLGESFPIPPRTADLITERRRLMVHLDDRVTDNAYNHTGWGEIFVPANVAGIDDALTKYALCVELAEMYNVPVSFPAALHMQISTEPARMRVYNMGMTPLTNRTQTLSTPSLTRVAWEGAEFGLWDMEDVFTLPPPMVPIPPEALEAMEDEYSDAGVTDVYPA